MIALVHRWTPGLVLLLLAAGCTGSDGRLTVTGTVKGADGSPLGGENGQIVFSSATGGQSAVTGDLAADGTFTLAADGAKGGVLPGEYKVVVRAYTSYRDLKLLSPESYADTATTPLKATVESGSTEFDFVVE